MWPVQVALFETRREAEILSAALEDPDNAKRFRMLAGKAPDKEALVAKIQVLVSQILVCCHTVALRTYKAYSLCYASGNTHVPLLCRLQSLEDRLGTKRESAIEREVVLGEVTKLADKLGHQADEGRGTTFVMATQANKYQQKLRNVTHKMMATISELSLYQVCYCWLHSTRYSVCVCW